MRELDIDLITELSEIQYKGTYIYRYLIDKLILVDETKEVANNSGFSGINDVLPAGDGNIRTVDSVLRPYYEGLSARDVLFVGGMFRKNINGELFHTALDPYIDTLDSNRHLMVEPVNEINDQIPVHTKNLYRILRKDIVESYGIEHIDIEDLRAFMSFSVFDLVEEHYGVKLPSIQKDSIVSSLQWSLALHFAYTSFYREVLSRVSPKVVCYSHGTSRNCCFLYETAQSMGIPCVEIDHGAVVRTRSYPEHSKCSDLILSFSDCAAMIAAKSGVKDVYPVGKPGVLKKGETYMGTDMPANIVCVMSSCEKDLLQKACILSEVLPPERYVIIYKRHSTEKWTDEEEYVVKHDYSRLQIMDFAVDVNDIYKLCHIVIGERSSALLEAIPYEHIKILINRRPDDDMFSEEGRLAYFPYVIDNHEMIPTETVEDILEEILSYDRTINYRPNGDIYWCKDAERKFVELVDRYTANI